LLLEKEGAEDLLQACAAVLRGGGLVILPTETVYGLAAKADHAPAVRRLFQVKGRSPDKPLVVMVSSTEEAAALVAPEDRDGIRRLGTFWPGPLTLVARAAGLAWLEEVRAGSADVGLRVPHHPFLLRLLAEVGPLAVTSANLSGGEAPARFADLDPVLLEGVELAVDGGESGTGRPSTVALVSGGRLKVLREGDLGEEELRRAWGSDAPFPEEAGPSGG